MKTRLEIVPFDFRIDAFSDYPIRVFPRLNKDNGNSDFIDSKNSEICEKVIFVIQGGLLNPLLWSLQEYV